MTSQGMTPSGRQLLVTGAQELGLELGADSPQLEKFAQLLLLLQEGQTKQNLGTLKSENDIIIKHFVDSLSCLLAEPLALTGQALRLLDLGTGAGFPSLPLAIMRPELQITPLDATRKKIDFVQASANSLGLSNVTTLVCRAEQLGHDPQQRAQYDRVVARAVSSLPTVAELSLPLLKQGGLLIAQKGAIGDDELEAGAKAAEVLGAEIRQVQHFDLPIVGDARSLVILAKTKPTSSSYPRRDGLPATQPLFWHSKTSKARKTDKTNEAKHTAEKQKGRQTK